MKKNVLQTKKFRSLKDVENLKTHAYLKLPLTASIKKELFRKKGAEKEDLVIYIKKTYFL